MDSKPENLKQFLALDASIFDGVSTREEVKLDVQYNRIRFEFPAGFNQLDLLDECRVWKDPDNFDMLFALTMKMLAAKPVVIKMLSYEDQWVEVTKFQVTNAEMNLRGVEFINAFPVVIVWLTEFVTGHLLKKFPLPSKLVPASTSNGTQKKREKKAKAPTT